MEIEVNYSPHKGQEKFHQDRLNVKWRALIGGTGSGKTRAGCAEMLIMAAMYPGSVGAIFEPTHPMINRILIPTLNKLLGNPFWRNPLITSYNRADNVITFYKGTEIWLNGLMEPERSEGQNLDWGWLDEARLVPKLGLALQVIERRLRGSGSGSPISGLITTTPDAPGSDLHKFIEDPITRTANSRIYRMSIFDNPYLPREYIEGIIKSHPGALGERFIYGKFAHVGDTPLGFDYTKHVLDKATERNLLRNVVYGVDWGWTNPTAIVAIGFDHDGRAIALEEIYERQMKDTRIVETIKDLQNRWGTGIVVCGHEQPKSINFLRANGIAAQAESIKRDESVLDLGSRFQDDGSGNYRLYIYRECVNLIAEMQTYNPDEKVNDHAVDALRYGLSKAETGPPTSRRGRVW